MMIFPVEEWQRSVNHVFIVQDDLLEVVAYTPVNTNMGDSEMKKLFYCYGSIDDNCKGREKETLDPSHNEKMQEYGDSCEEAVFT